MIISMIAAHDPGLVIGKQGTLPWHIPEDLAHFKERTTGHIIVMGRKVFEELGEKPLPKRRNIVLSRTCSYSNVETFNSKESLFQAIKGEEKIFIIGGEQIYHEFYDECNRLEITEIKKRYQGDTFFPEYRPDIGRVWKEISRVDKDNLSFVDYIRSS